MRRIDALLLSAAVGIAAVAGAYAALRTTQLGAAATQAPRVPAAAIAHRSRVLDRAEAALRAQMQRKPPALPELPTKPTRSAPATTAGASPAPPPKVLYVRPKPVVHVVHRRGGEHEDGEGGGLDD